MVKEAPFDKIDNPFIQVPLLVKKPNPIMCTCYCSGGRRITSCHTPSIPTHSIPPKNAIFICPLRGFKKVPSPPHLMKAVQTNSGGRFLWKTGEWCQWWNKKCSGESCNTKCCSLSAVKWQLYFLCWHLLPTIPTAITFLQTLLKTQSLKLYTKLSKGVNQGNVKLWSQKITLSNLRNKWSKSHLKNSTPFLSLPFLIPCLRSQAQRLLQVTGCICVFQGCRWHCFLTNSSWISKTKLASQWDLGASTWLP